MTIWRIGLAGALLLSSTTGFAASVAAQLQWAAVATLGTPVSGVVESVHAATGERVKKDQVLVQLDARGFRARAVQAKAAHQESLESFAEAQREMERAEALYERTVLSDRELQLAKIAFAQAETKYQTTQAALTQAELDLEYSAVRAPFDGMVVRRTVEAGETLVNSSHLVPLITLAATDRMLARANVALEVARELRAGQEVAVAVRGERYTGTLRSVGMEPVAGTDVYAVDVEFALPADASLRVGEAATVELP